MIKMSRFKDFSNVDQRVRTGQVKAKYNAWKRLWRQGKKWGIVGGHKDKPKPSTVLDQILNHGNATYARDLARSIDGLADIIESITEVLDGDEILTEHKQKLQRDIDDLEAVLREEKWNPRNIPFTTVVKFAETDDPQKPNIEKGEVFGHYRTPAYNDYVAWAAENKKGFKGKTGASVEPEWTNKSKNKAKPPLWQAITGKGETDDGEGGILYIAKLAMEAIDDVGWGDNTALVVYNNSAGPRQLAKIQSIQDKVIEVIQNPSIYPAGKARSPVKDRLNAQFSGQSYGIKSEEEAKLLNFAKGYNDLANIEEIKSLKIIWPPNNKALNSTIRHVLEAKGLDIKTIATPKSREGTSKPGIVLKQVPKSWQDILRSN